MSQGSRDRASEAFRRLLADASEGGQAKIDAIIALAQRTIFVATWPPDTESFRTLTSSDGQSALPIFTDPDELAEASGRYGWVDPTGQPSATEIGARQAFRHALARNLQFIVVDITAAHSLEIAMSEVEPLITPKGRSDERGPFAGVGRVSSSMMQAVRPTPQPGSVPAVSLTPAPGTVKAPEIGTAEPPPPGSVSATFGSGSSVTLTPLSAEPPEHLLDALVESLRTYPEVEWAALCSVARGPAAAVPTIGLRVDPSFRQRVNEIISSVRSTAAAQSAALDVVLLDDAELLRTARQEALVFYPWRR